MSARHYTRADEIRQQQQVVRTLYDSVKGKPRVISDLVKSNPLSSLRLFYTFHDSDIGREFINQYRENYAPIGEFPHARGAGFIRRTDQVYDGSFLTYADLAILVQDVLNIKDYNNGPFIAPHSERDIIGVNEPNPESDNRPIVPLDMFPDESMDGLKLRVIDPYSRKKS